MKGRYRSPAVDWFAEQALYALDSLRALDLAVVPSSQRSACRATNLSHWPFVALYRQTTERQFSLAHHSASPAYQFALIHHFYRLFQRSVIHRAADIQGDSIRRTMLWDVYFDGLTQYPWSPSEFRSTVAAAVRAHIEGDLCEAMILAWRDLSLVSGHPPDLAAVRSTLFNPAGRRIYADATTAFVSRLRIAAAENPSLLGLLGTNLASPRGWWRHPLLHPRAIRWRRWRAWIKAAAILRLEASMVRSSDRSGQSLVWR